MAISEKEYVEYIKNFCKENQGKRVIQDGKEDYIVYDSPSAILASRVMEEKIQRVKNSYEHDTCYVAVASGQCSHISSFDFSQPYLEEGLSKHNKNYSYNNFLFYFTHRDFWQLSLKENNYKKTSSIEGNLRYDGICVYLALASDQNLLANKDKIADEIARNARETMEYVEKYSNGDAEMISYIGNKYIELKCVAREVLVQAQERIDAQENMADNENLVENLTSGEVMQKLNDISFVSDDEVQE